MNIDNWKKVPSKDLESGKLREMRNQEAKRATQQANATQIKQYAKVQQAKLRLKLAQSARQKVSISNDHQHGLSARRARNTGLRQAAVNQAGKLKSQQDFLKTRDASRLLTKLSQTRGANPATKGAVTSKSQSPEVHTQRQQPKGFTLSQTANRVPHKGKAPEGTRTKTESSKAKATSSKKQPDAKTNVKRGDQLKTPPQQKGTDAATRASLAGTAAAKGQQGVKDGSKRTEKKDTESKERKSSLASNAGKANAKKLGKLLDGGGFDANVDVTAKDTEWQPGESEAIGTNAEGDATKRTLMDENPGAMTFTAVTQDEKGAHDIWNKNKTFTDKVIKPRLKQIADLNAKLSERLAEMPLPTKVVMDLAKDPEVGELLRRCMNQRSNSYGGMSGV